MQSIKLEVYEDTQDAVKELVGTQDSIVIEFDVIPLDHVVKDVLSPKVYLTRTRFILVVDNLIEVYNLNEIAVWTIGDAPNFSLTKQLLEPRLDYIPSKTPLSKNTDIPDEIVRFAIMERNSLQKEFVLRKGEIPAKSYQTWAFAQLAKNLQKGMDDYRLRHMISGSFSVFEGLFLVGALAVFVIYVLISVLLGGILPSLIMSILDFLFAVVCIVVLGWMFWTIFVNIKNYRKIYTTYKMKESGSSSVKKQ